MLGEAKVKIGATLQPLKTALSAARKLTVRSLSSLGKSVVSGMTSVVKSAMRTLITSVKWAVAGITAAMVAIGISSARMAADVEESENLFVVSMGNMVKSTMEWSNRLSKALGLNQFEVRKFVSTFNVMLNSMGIGEKESAKMAQKMTELAYDMASFFNLKPEEAFMKLQSGITGEIEPLKRLGIIVNETTVKNYAMSQGLVEQGEKLTEVQKIMSRYNLILSQTQKAQGDLARTMDSTQNVGRRLESVLSTTRVTIGERLNPAITQIKKEMISWLTDNQERIRAWANVAGENLLKVYGWLKDILATIKDEGWSAALDKIGIKIKAAFQITLEKLKPVAMELGHSMAEGFKSAFGIKSKIGITAGGAVAGGIAGAKFGPMGAAVGAIAGGELSARATGLPSPSALFASPANFGVEMMKLAAAMERNANALEKQNEVK